MHRASVRSVIALVLSSGLAAAGAADPLPAMGPQIPVSVSTVDLQFRPKVAVFPDGGFVVAWNATAKKAPLPPKFVVHARFFNAAGAPVSGEFLLLSTFSGPLLDGVAAVGNNRLVVLWEGGPPGLQMQLFNRSGKAVSAATRVPARCPFECSNAVLATNAAGGIAVLWSSMVGNGDDPALRTDGYARFFDKRLAPLTGDVLVRQGSSIDHSGPLADSAALAPDGSLVASLTYVGDSASIFLARLAADGSALPVGDPEAGACCTGANYDSSVALAADGSFFVDWDFAPTAAPGSPPPLTPPSPIGGRLIDARGTPTGSDYVTVNRHAGSQLGGPLAATLPAAAGAAFVAVWQDPAGRDGSGYGLFGRLIDASGQPLFRDFQIDTASSGDQYGAAIAAGPNGAVVVWLSGATGTVYARQITATQ